MKLKTSVSLMVALVLGLVTAKVGLDLLKKYKPAGTAVARVIVAKRDMEPGYVIETADVEPAEVPLNLVPAKAAKAVSEVVGRTVIAQVASGQTMFDGLLAGKGSGSGFQAMIPAGMRAVTLDMSDSSAVAGMLTVGCKVDVIAALRKGDQTVARTIVENVTVQYVQRSRSGFSSKTGPVDNGPVRTVTLLVKPRQASAIELANAQGARPRLVLRGRDDQGLAESDMTNRELTGEPEEVAAVPTAAPEPKDDSTFNNVAPAAEPSKGRPVSIIRAGQETTIYYNDQTGASTPAAENDKSKKEEGATPAAAGKKPSGEEPRTASGKSADASKSPETSTRTDVRSSIR